MQENRAKVVLAEAEVPLAMAEALRSGNLGVMDHYRLKQHRVRHADALEPVGARRHDARR